MINQIHLSDTVKNKLPGIKFGTVTSGNIRVVKEMETFDQSLNDLIIFLKNKFGDQPLSGDPIISAVRRLYYRVGWEPTRYRPSSEALIRRIISGKGLYRINNLVDLGNLISAQFHLPMGLYDAGKINGEIELDVGKAGEHYEGISKEIIHADGKLILRDKVGIFGNPTADSKRTSIQSNTKGILALFFCPQEIEDSYINDTLKKLKDYYQAFSTDDISTEIVKFQ
ncbi:MAG: hypothetical protein JXR46_15870 [Calditrichaceae bacterium]|nr:hypothetical protein [Calditrichaceae bacterium]MBN2710522.1 hypothetical protein [Calditrichaceae bacterium]